MPVIVVEGPKVDDIEKKRQLVKKFTEVASEVYGIAKEHFVVLIKENLPENVGSGGELIADRMRR